MTQTFDGAQPRVVQGKNKFRKTDAYGLDGDEEDDRNALNIMYDKRVFRGNTHNLNQLKANQTPAQKEEMRIKHERELKKVEMIKQQLLEFKKQKQKTSPYDLRPGAPARIEVDLTYFLTEQGRELPEETTVKTQTDVFLPKPPTPKYVPKKTGIDKITQIGDYDLFHYDKEVQPILNVLLTKTVEQAILEVEEETELEEIRKFKTEYQKRADANHENWQQEVRRESNRIKQKNKALNNARAKREQQIKTMHKLQCLNISKNFLQGCFMGTMTQLSEQNNWRNTFNDQLSVAFKDQLLNSVLKDSNKFNQNGSMVNNFVGNQFTAITKQKESIKGAMVAKNARREKSRAIESVDRRIVHFIFDPQQPRENTPFAQKFQLLMKGDAEMQEAEEYLTKTCDEYIEKVEQEALDGESYPFEFDNNLYDELELNDLHRLSFAVADNPFVKSDVDKFYPEIHVISGQGEILATINPMNRNDDRFGASMFCSDFRDDKLKINDDRKVKLTLSDFNEKDTMILLTVRANDLSGEKVDVSQYANAWFRLQNEDTNQSLDYQYVKKVDLPEGFEDEAAADGEEEAEEADGEPKKKNEIIYLAGRLFREDPKTKPKPVRTGNETPISDDEEEEVAPKWIYEKWNKAISTAQYPAIEKTLAELHFRARDQIDQFEAKLVEAKTAVTAKEEAKRKAEEAAKAAKQKKGAKAKKGKKGEEIAEEEPATPIATGAEEEKEEEELDLTDLTDFKKALRQRTPRPFTFGPIEFRHLNLSQDKNPFDDNKVRQEVVDRLDTAIGQPIICIKGYEVLIKGKTLRRRTSILKHSRFLQNLTVVPNFPEELVPVDEDENDGQEEPEAQMSDEE